MDVINTIGRRKSSVARIYLKQGEGKITINGRDLKEYFTMENIQNVVLAPFATIDAVNQFDVKINVDGGGFKGQAEAIRMGIARSLVKLDEENRKALKEKKFLTRDAREVERKKYGKPKARKSFQFSKR
jgi:small subunit ribosomal protein S9